MEFMKSSEQKEVLYKLISKSNCATNFETETSDSTLPSKDDQPFFRDHAT